MTLAAFPVWCNESKEIRDRAYTFLHQGLDKARRCGFFALHGNEDRLKGFKALYKPRTSNSKAGEAEPETGGEGEEQKPYGTD